MGLRGDGSPGLSTPQEPGPEALTTPEVMGRNGVGSPMLTAPRVGVMDPGLNNLECYWPKGWWAPKVATSRLMGPRDDDKPSFTSPSAVTPQADGSRGLTTPKEIGPRGDRPPGVEPSEG